MKIFVKIFISIFCFVIAVVSLLSLIMVRNQVAYVKQEAIAQARTLGDFLSKQIEIGFIQSQLPYESLSKLTKTENFLFWWIVKDDGLIYRANDTAFMETPATEYFPQVSKMSPKETIYLDKSGNFGISITSIQYGSNNWKFWYGFSMKNLEAITRTILLNSTGVIIVSLLLLGAALYYMVAFFLQPIKSLLEGVKEISKGNLDYTVNVRSKDEIGDLAAGFRDMTIELKKSKQTLEEYNKKLEQQVAERTNALSQKMEELERMNTLMINRELKMVELKKRIDDLELSKK